MVSGIGIVTHLEKVNYEKKDKSGSVDGFLVHCVVYEENVSRFIVEFEKTFFDDKLKATLLFEDLLNYKRALQNCKVCYCWCSNKPDSFINCLAVGDKVQIRFGKYGEYITSVLK